jgi:type VI protein secretion system component VasK
VYVVGKLVLVEVNLVARSGWKRLYLVLLFTLLVLYFVVLCSIPTTMPLAWNHDMSKQQLEDLASQMGQKTDRTLDDLRRV